MTTPFAPAISPPPTDDQVTWFGASKRTIGGRPDSRYGWLNLPDGPCIVKAMDPDLVAYNHTLQAHERQMLRRLQTLGAPVPVLVEVGRPDWLVTRFAGLSLQRLEHAAGLHGTAPEARFPLEERVAAWQSLLRRLQATAEAGVLAIDLYEANVVLPLTQGTSGQLRLREAMLIDHAHTLEAGMAVRRPVWLNREMPRIPPELRAALDHDQQALVAHFAAADAALPGYSRLAGDRDAHSRRVWAEYSAPQALQQLLDAGQLNRDHAMQFAAATAMTSLLKTFSLHPQCAALAKVLQRMSQPGSAQRYHTLTDAADALCAVMAPLPLVSRYVHAALQPEDLAAHSDGPGGSARPTAITISLAPSPNLTPAPASVPPTRPTRPATEPPAAAFTAAARQGRHWPWVCAAAALGAALGAGLPLPL